MAEGFFEFGCSGKVLYKENNISKEGIGAVKMKMSEFDVHPLADSVVLATYRIFNEESKQHSLRSSIWKLEKDGWKMVFHQGTKTEASSFEQ